MQDLATYKTSRHKTSRHSAALVFTGVLAAGLAVQMTLWLVFPIADENWWATDAAKIAAGTALGPADVTYVHPGTTILYPMAALVHFSADPKIAVRLVMAAFAAICTAFAAMVAYRLYPQHLWWLAVALILVPDLRLLHGTPPSTAATLLTVLFVLLLMYAGRTRHFGTYRPLIYLGICSGLLLATRFDTGAFVFITASPFLVYMFRYRVLVLFLTTALVFAASNSHVWTDPIVYLSSIPQQMFANKALVGIHILVPFLLTFPFAIFSILLSLVVAYKQFLRPVDGEARVQFDIYLWFLGTTALFTALLAPLSFHPIRYFMPFYLVWDILLPLWVLIFAYRYLPAPRLPWLTEKCLEWIVIGLIILIISIRLLILLTADTREIIL